MRERVGVRNMFETILKKPQIWSMREMRQRIDIENVRTWNTESLCMRSICRYGFKTENGRIRCLQCREASGAAKTKLADDASGDFNLKFREPTVKRLHFATSDCGIVMAAGCRIFVIVNAGWDGLISQLGSARGTTQPAKARLWQRDFRMTRKRATNVKFRSGGESHLL
jgi:hypothetical protein